jgi:cytochrome c-type biogenesis protein CcmE
LLSNAGCRNFAPFFKQSKMKKAHIVGIVIIAIAIAAILSTVADSSTYASFETAMKQPDREFHVVGKLNKEKEMSYNPTQNANLFTFFLVDNKGQELKVSYNGSKPQDFDKSEQIVVVGKCTDNEFKAASILMKCPSKYNDGTQLKEFKTKS